MTIRGRTQAYAAGNKTYGFGRSNPTSGPVDPLGYKERDAKRMLQNPVASQGAVSQAIARRAAMAARPAATPNPQIAALKGQMAGIAGAARPAGTPPGGGSTIGTAGNETTVRPNATGQNVTQPAPRIAAPAPAPVNHTATGATHAPQYDMSANNSQGLALTDAQRNSQQMNMEWARAHGVAPTYYDQMFSSPITEINGQIVANPAFQGSGAVNGQTVTRGANGGLTVGGQATDPSRAIGVSAAGYGQPGTTPTQLPPGIGAQGVEGLGYDPAYANFLAQQQQAQGLASQALQNGQHAAQTQAYAADRTIDQQGQQGLEQLLNNFAGRGMAFSGAYGTNVGQAQNEIAGQHANVQQSLTDILNQLQGGYNDTINSGYADNISALEAYIANLAQNAGSLGLQSGQQYQQQAGAGDAEYAALLQKLLGMGAR